MTFDHDAGWIELPGFVTAREIDELLRCTEALASLPATKRHARDKAAAGTRHIAAVHQRIALVADLVERSPLVDLVGELLGPEPTLTEAEVRCPQPGYGGQRLHADGAPLLTPEPAQIATAIMALVDFTAANGATRVVPGSHRRTVLQRQSGQLASHPDEIVLTGAAGTVFVFNGHVLHSGTKNVSGHDRPALHLVWRRQPTSA